MDLKLNGKRALVCGGSQGIGEAVAIELANLGCSVTLIARNEERMMTVLSKLKQSEDQTHDYLSLDFSNVQNVQAGIERFLSSSNHTINILVNNTGGPKGGPIQSADLSEFQQAFNNHLLCNHAITQAVLPKMKESGYGRIINIISTSVKVPLTGLGVSNTIRGAVANWAKTMANELGAYGITVNNVLPGATSTQRLAQIVKNKAAKLNLTEKEAEAKMLSVIPLKRFAKPNEIGNAVAFLGSPAAAYISGTNVVVDGGRTASL